ncbi:MAG: hypothetical protein ACFFBD_04230 [Candidatus Hodarchaeota archaeon]
MAKTELELRRKKAKSILNTGKLRFENHYSIIFPSICLSCLSPLPADNSNVKIYSAKGDKELFIEIPNFCESCKHLKIQKYVKYTKPQSGPLILQFSKHLVHRDGYLTKLLEINPDLWNVTPAEKIKAKREERDRVFYENKNLLSPDYRPPRPASDPNHIRLDIPPANLEYCQECDSKITVQKSDSGLWAFYNCKICGKYVYWKDSQIQRDS